MIEPFDRALQEDRTSTGTDLQRFFSDFVRGAAREVEGRGGGDGFTGSAGLGASGATPIGAAKIGGSSGCPGVVGRWPGFSAEPTSISAYSIDPNGICRGVESR